MPIKLSQLRSKTKTIPVLFDGESVLVSYRLNAVTPEFLDMISGPLNGETVCHAIEQVIDDWDVLDEAGQHLPATYAVMRSLPLVFLQIVMEAISDDVKPGEAIGASSDGG